MSLRTDSMDGEVMDSAGESLKMIANYPETMAVYGHGRKTGGQSALDLPYMSRIMCRNVQDLWGFNSEGIPQAGFRSTVYIHYARCDAVDYQPPVGGIIMSVVCDRG